MMRKQRFRNQPASVSGLLAEVKKKLAHATNTRNGGLETTVVTNQLFGHDIDTDEEETDAPQPNKDVTDTSRSRQRKKPPQLVLQRVFINFEFESSLFANRLHSFSYLGKGGFALVFKAQYQLPTGESLAVAIKVLKPKHLNKASHYRRFLQEYAVHSVLKHRAHTPPHLLDKHAEYLTQPNSAAGAAKVPSTKCWAIVQEFMEENTLYSLVALQWQYRNSTIYTNEDALGWMIDVAEAMAYLHSCDPMVIHRDLKLENILLKQGPQGTLIAKLGDFGLVVAVDKDGRKSPLPQLLHHPRDVMPTRATLDSSTMAKLMAEPLDKQLLELEQKMLKATTPPRASTALSETIRANWSGGAAAAASPATAATTPEPAVASPAAGNDGDSPRTAKDPQPAAPEASTSTSPRTPAPRSPSGDGHYLNPLTRTQLQPAPHRGDAGGPASPSGRDAGGAGGGRPQGVPIGSLSPGHWNAQAAAAQQQQQGQKGPHGREEPRKSPERNRSRAGGGGGKESKEAKNAAAAPLKSESLKSQQPEVVVGPSRSWPGTAGDGVGGIDRHGDPRQTVMGPCRAMDPNTVRRMQPQQMTSVEGMARPFNATYRLTARCGSLLYMAPEVARDQPYNEKVDVFSFGVILYEVFGRDLVAATYVQQNNMEGYVKYAQKVAWLGFRPTVQDRLPHDLKALIKSCWHKDPRKRPSFATIVRKLKAMRDSGLMRRMDLEDCEAKVDLTDKWRTALTAPPDFFSLGRELSLEPASERNTTSRSNAMRFLCGCFTTSN